MNRGRLRYSESTMMQIKPLPLSTEVHVEMHGEASDLHAEVPEPYLSMSRVQIALYPTKTGALGSVVLQYQNHV